MAKVERFEDLEVWRKAREPAKLVHETSSKGTFARDFSLRDQINRSAGSTMDNIAEGFERGGNKEMAQFLSISKGSCGEVRSQLYRAFDKTHINSEELKVLLEKVVEISKQLHGFMSYIKSSDYRGEKYVNEPNLEF